MNASSDIGLADALLALGLEDVIPLWEAAMSGEVVAAAPAADPIEAIAQALSSLLIDARIRVYQGHWSADPEPVSTDQGLTLLANHRWYAYPPEQDRVYFVNVENMPEP